MMDVNIMHGRQLGLNDPVGVGVGLPIARLEKVLEETLPEHWVKVTPKTDRCVIEWQPYDEADRYRVDLYRIEDRGPSMRCFNYIMTQSEWTQNTTLDTVTLYPMTSYRAIIFAYKGEKFVGRYKAEYCIVAHQTVGDMLCDNLDDYDVDEPDLLCDTIKKIPSLPAEKSVILNNNPERGFRTEGIYSIPPKEEIAEWTRERVIDKVIEGYKESVLDEKVMVSRTYFVLENYVNEEKLPDAVIDYMDAVYEAHKILGVRMYLCHFYMRGQVVDQPPLERVLTHLEQIKSLFYKHRDIIFAANFTFLGRYGEWTSIRIPLDYQKFVNEFMDAVPPEIRLIVRQPRTKAAYVNKEYWRYPRIGFADDACHGLAFESVDIGQGYNQPGSVWWEMDVKESPYTINDTELFTIRWIRISGSWPDGYSCMQSLSQKHTSTLSMEHGYSDVHRFGGELSQTCLEGWKSQEVTPEILFAFGLAVSPNWFYDKDGNRVRRNVFEYLRDYVGYRISAESLKVSVEDEVKFSLKLKNYGYTAGFNLKSNFVLLDEDFNVISQTEAGDPETWYGTNPAVYEDRDLLEHTVESSFSIPSKNGKYMLGLCLENPFGQNARLDNAIPFKNGYNILHSFEIK